MSWIGWIEGFLLCVCVCVYVCVLINHITVKKTK
jgi:hypothetical protein